jgi:starvation-inducible DNA-binding protein
MVNKSKKSSDKVVKLLRKVLADSYALMAQTHLCHWNVRGPGFFALHTAFEMQYTELFTAVDEIAERIRALGKLAPGGLSSLADLSGIREIKEDTAADEMVKHLADINRKLVGSLVAARDAAADSVDAQTEDMMIARIQVHEKTVWMLESYLS